MTKRNTDQPTMADQLAKARLELGGLTERVIKELEDLSRPSSSISLKATDPYGDLSDVKYILLRGTWMDIGNNIQMMLIDQRAGCSGCPMFKVGGQMCENARCDYSRVLMEANVPTIAAKHAHAFNENITVIRGWLKETESGSYIEEGAAKTSIVFDAGFSHQIQCMGLFMVYWSPCKMKEKFIKEVC